MRIREKNTSKQPQDIRFTEVQLVIFVALKILFLQERYIFFIPINNEMIQAIVHKDVILRGDLASIRVGKFSIIRSGTIIRPGHRKFSKGVTTFPVHIGDHVMIEEACFVTALITVCSQNCLISAGQICSFVHVGADSVIGSGAIIKECCRVLPGAVVAAEAVFPPFSTIAGNPGNNVLLNYK